MARANAADYTYLTLPPDRTLGACIGLVVAGLAARAKIGVAALEEAVELLEGQRATEGPTRYRFSLREDGLVAEVQEGRPAAVGGGVGESGWRTVVELIS